MPPKCQKRRFHPKNTTARGGTRTLTLLPRGDFKSPASANSATRASHCAIKLYIRFSRSPPEISAHFTRTAKSRLYTANLPHIIHLDANKGQRQKDQHRPDYSPPLNFPPNPTSASHNSPSNTYPAHQSNTRPPNHKNSKKNHKDKQ